MRFLFKSIESIRMKTKSQPLIAMQLGDIGILRKFLKEKV